MKIDHHLRFHQFEQVDHYDQLVILIKGSSSFSDNRWVSLISSTEGFENLIASTLSSNVMWKVSLVCCLLVLKTLEALEIKVDKNAIFEFSTIVISQLFDMNVILIFNSFDERHNGF
ncbi:hypothetical protein Tco_1361867, partial [Tanacetum coccineum]